MVALCDTTMTVWPGWAATMSSSAGKARAVTESPSRRRRGERVGIPFPPGVRLAVHSLDLGPGHPLPVTVRDLAQGRPGHDRQAGGSARMAAVPMVRPSGDEYTAATSA